MKQRISIVMLATGLATGFGVPAAHAAADSKVAVTDAKPEAKSEAKPEAAMTHADELAQKAAGAVTGGKYSDALDLVREAYRQDPTPLWLYDMAVVHDHMGECDDAAFMYRAALWGKGVQAQDKDLVEARLNVLEEKCHFKKRHATAVDRHARAGRYLGLKLCPLAKAILTGIATTAETAQITECEATMKK